MMVKAIYSWLVDIDCILRVEYTFKHFLVSNWNQLPTEISFNRFWEDAFRDRIKLADIHRANFQVFYFFCCCLWFGSSSGIKQSKGHTDAQLQWWGKTMGFWVTVTMNCGVCLRAEVSGNGIPQRALCISCSSHEIQGLDVDWDIDASQEHTQTSSRGSLCCYSHISDFSATEFGREHSADLLVLTKTYCADTNRI